MECNICGVKIKSDGPADKGAGSGIFVGVGGITGAEEGTGAVEEEGAGVSGGAEMVGPLISYPWPSLAL